MYYRAIEKPFGPGAAARLLAYALANQARFEPAGLGAGQGVDGGVRVSQRLADLGAHRVEIERAVAALVPGLIADLRLTPFEPSGYETEIVAHGDGAFYGPHVDLFSGAVREVSRPDRLLSVVYYFFSEPRAFSGGVLRLFPDAGLARGGAETRVDIEAAQDTALAFSSWMRHEVTPVSCPSRRFGDSRFTVNCWVLR